MNCNGRDRSTSLRKHPPHTGRIPSDVRGLFSQVTVLQKGRIPRTGLLLCFGLEHLLEAANLGINLLVLQKKIGVSR